MRSRVSRIVSLVGVPALVAGLIGVSGIPAAAETTAVSVPIVTEIQADNTGYDNFEYIEVTNPTDTAIDFAESGYSLSYRNGSTSTELTTAMMDGSEGTPDLVLQPGQVVVLWLSYTSGNVDSWAQTEDAFREAVGLTDTTVSVVRIEGQAGIKNTGDRGIDIVQNGEVVSESYLPEMEEAPGTSTHFALPIDATTKQLQVWQQSVAGTPGAVDEAQLADDSSEGDTGEGGDGGATGEDDSDTGKGGDTPTDTTHDATPGFDPAADESATGPILRITEVLPDSSNQNGSDAFEFIEVYNASTEAIDFSDYVIAYLYPTDYDTNTSESLWPATDREVTIASGDTLVFWIKNSGNTDLTTADFNAKFGTDLVDGETIVQIESSGMANSSARGVAVRTNTGETISRAYYNMTTGQDDTSADQGIQYGPNTDTSRTDIQGMIGYADATPGTVTQEQVSTGLIVRPTDTQSPTIVDQTMDTIDGTEDLTIAATITDDQLVRTVELTYSNDVDETATTLQLTNAGDDLYTATITAGDLSGKSRIDYTFTARDGSTEASSATGTVTIDRGDTGPVNVNVDEGQVLSGEVSLVASGDLDSPEILIDGQSQETTASLADEPVFLFETTNTDTFFQNGVKVTNTDTGDDDLLTIFEDGTYAETETISTDVPLSYVQQGNTLTLSVWAGTKAYPQIDENENNDDFLVKSLRLVLPDGRTLYSSEWSTSSDWISMGDSTGKNDFITATFTIPDDAFSASAYAWDTTATEDGEHTVSATSGDDQLDVTVSVDNTAPEVSLDVSSENDTELGMHGDITLTASIDDGSGSGVPDSGVVAELDGVSIDVPYVTSTVDLAAGQHTFSVTATDAAGNIQTVTQTFTTVDEEPDSIDVSVASTGEIGDDGTGSVTVSATATDPTGDDLTVQFNEGTSLELGTDVSVSSGEVNDALSTDRSAGVSLTTEELADLGSTDGIGYTTTGSDALPYQLFTVTVPEGTSDEDQVRVTWEGTSNANAQVTLYAQLADGSGWTQVDRQYNEDGASFTLTGYVPVADYAVDGVVTLVVQHSDGWSGEDTTTRDSEVEAYSDEATDRSDYDFTIAWESDTQYYNEDLSSNYYYLEDMNNFLMEERENLNLKYMLHTGDIVDDYDQTYEWENADQAYNILEEDADGNALSVDEKLPYGVLAGNHDVGHLEDDFATFGTYFGEDRYDDNPWYGGSYENNRGHYDLFSAGGIDFMVVSMGWDPGEEEIAWMNEVVSAHPERVVILTFHEYMLTTGGLGPIPQTVYDEVVATNSNVKMVLSGHYHDAYTRYDSFDDDGDGVDDRTVTSMLFDYQALESGGLGYLRLMHFDNESETMTVRTYSPTLDDFNAEDSSLYGPNGEVETYQDFTISYETLGISPQTKILTTDAFSADVLTNAAGITDAEVETSAGIGEVSVASGEQAAVTWSGLEPGVYGVYATATDPYGAQIVSTVQTFTLRDDGSVVDGVASTSTGSDDGDDESSDNGGSSEGGDGGSSDNGGSSDEGDGGSSTGDDGDDAPTLTLLGGDTVRVGDTMTVTAEGLEPGADYTLTLHSTPVVVGQVTVGDAGTATFTFTIPSDTAVGDHTLQLTADAEPSVVLAELPIEVLAASDGSSLLNSSAGSVALWALAGLVLLAGGTGVVLLAHRRAQL